MGMVYRMNNEVEKQSYEESKQLKFGKGKLKKKYFKVENRKTNKI